MKATHGENIIYISTVRAPWLTAVIIIYSKKKYSRAVIDRMKSLFLIFFLDVITMRIHDKLTII